MSLQPTRGVLASVIKMEQSDPDAAREYVRLGLYESLVDQIEAHRPELECDALRLIESQVAKARSHLLREYVGKALDGQVPADAHAQAEGLAILDAYVAKAGFLRTVANQFSGDPDWDEKEHKRGGRGRFVRMATGVKLDRRLSTEQKQAVSVSNAKNVVQQAIGDKLIAPKDKVIAHFSTSPNRGDRNKDIALRMQADRIDSEVEQFLSAKGHTMSLTGVSIEPKLAGEPGAGPTAAFDALNRFTSAGPAQSKRLAGALPYGATPEEVKEYSENWNNLSDGPDRRSYRRMTATGQALQLASAPGSNASIVGGLAQLVGNIGPEAERVLSPGFTRVAYRYRGTEKRPDAEMMQQMAQINPVLAELDAGSPETEVKIEQAFNTINMNTGDPLNGTAGYYLTSPKHQGMTQDQLTMRTRGDIIAADLVDKLPNPKLTRLNLEAGQTPPSQGVMIDSDGRIVTQAQGFNGDHYLPFDLKNLKSLHGGQYVRTRTIGGPTTEDIYTGLLAGARQMQVVSNSGVFTIELDPDLRGGRRYTDKATKMVERYGKILDAVSSSKLMRQDIPAELEAELRQEAYESVGWDETRGQVEFDRLKEIARTKARTGMEQGGDETTRARIDAEVEAKMANIGESNQNRANIREEFTRRARSKANESAVRGYQLDGPGYHDALRALQAEFPYFIRSVDYQEMPEFFATRKLGHAPDVANAFASDRSYVAPGLNRASAEHQGYHNKNIKVGRFKTEDQRKEAEAKATAEAEGQGAAARLGGVRSASAAGGVQGTAGAQTVKIGGSTFTTARETKKFSEVIGPGSVQARQLEAEIVPLMNIINTLPRDAFIMDNMEGVPDPANEYPLDFTKKKWTSFDEDSRGKDFAEYLLSASEKERNAVIGSLKQLPTILGLYKDDPAMQGRLALSGGLDAMDKKITNAANLASLANPFAVSAGDETAMALADPSRGVPKPQPFPAVVALGATPANYTGFRASASVKRNTRLSTMLDEYAKLDDKTIAGLITDSLSEHHRLRASPAVGASSEATRVQDLSQMQQAWTFTRAEKLAEAANGGVIDPKWLAGQPAQPTELKSASLPEPRRWLVPVAKAEDHRDRVLAHLADRYGI